eukprot:6490644-Amphidinium_carterae.2
MRHENRAYTTTQCRVSQKKRIRYKLMKQYQLIQKYQIHFIHSQMNNQQRSTSSRKLSITTAELCSTQTKVTKGEPYRFVVQCNHNNASGFETWRRLRMTYDQGEKAQQLGTLSRIMKATWNNVQQQQQPGDFIKIFQNWRDEIYNYENSVSETMKMALLMQYIQGDIKPHPFLNVNSAKADFDDAATKIENYYRNVYIDQKQRWRNTSTWKTLQGLEAFERQGKRQRQKLRKRLLERRKRLSTTTVQAMERKRQRWKGKGKGKGYYGYQNYTQPKGGYNNYRKSKGKGKGKGPPLPSTPYYNTGGKRTDIVCYNCGKPGHTSDKCWWKLQIYNIDQAQPVWSLPNDNPAQQLQQVPLSLASTTIMTQPQQTRLENINIYDQQPYHTGIHSMTGSTLIVNKDNTTTDQLRIIDT